MCTSESCFGSTADGAPIMTSCAVLVHRERDDLTDAVLTGKQHDHTVNARSDTGVWRSTVAECVVHGREFCLHIVLAKSYELECLDHDLRVVVADRTGGELYAVADQIVLVCVDVERILVAQSASRPPCGMENGLWQNSSSPDSSPISYIGKSTIQQNS